MPSFTAPGVVKDYDVPVLTFKLHEYHRYQWDLATQQVYDFLSVRAIHWFGHTLAQYPHFPMTTDMTTDMTTMDREVRLTREDKSL